MAIASTAFLAVHTWAKVGAPHRGKPSRKPEQPSAMVQVRLNALFGLGCHGTPRRRRRRSGACPSRIDVMFSDATDIDELQHGRGHVTESRAVVEELRLERDLVMPVTCRARSRSTRVAAASLGRTRCRQ